ncbi:MAG: glycosyltransferase family 2 protein [Bacillota bacterium]|nr:glycosyltransferase family 2 protein [Bacillota bacterium]
METLVSVVIPAYNCEKYIKETLYSVINQSYKNIEVLVIDDGSKDNTGEAVKELMREDNRIRYLHKDNEGVSKARNMGIIEAKGQYIAFLDSDDLWNKEKLRLQMDRITETDADACYCGYTNWYEDSGLKVNSPIKYSEGNIIFKYLKIETWPQTSTWLIKKDLLMRHSLQFTPGCSWGEDFEFFAKVISLGKVAAASGFLTLYRIRNTGALSNFSLNYLKELDVWKRLMLWLKENEQAIGVNTGRIIKQIEHYRIPKTVIEVLWIASSDEELREQCRQYYSLEGTKRCIKSYRLVKPSSNDLRTLIKGSLLWFKLR